MGERRALLAAGGSALVLAAGYLLAPPMGTDLSAQQARADFAHRYGTVPVDLRWYGGTVQYGYSLLSQFGMAAVGTRLLGALAAVVASVAFAFLLVRGGAYRPVLGGILGAVVLVGNLASGRVTFALGLAFGTAALAACWLPKPFRFAVAAALAGLSTWASPVAGLFVGLAGLALILAKLPTRQPSGGGIALCAGAGVAFLPMLFLGDGGRQLYTAESMRINVALAVAAFLLVSARYPAVRVGAVLAGVLLAAAYYVPSPLGFNAARLTMLFTVPVVAALARCDWRWLTLGLVATVWWQPPIVTSDLGNAGAKESHRAFYRPLVDELSTLDPLGRVEVVPLRDHWESAYVAAAVPLARGWERQVDVARNPLFYRDTLSTEDYGDWLRRNAVDYVAIAPGSQPDRYARTEAAVVEAAPPYLTEVWRDAHWRLYAVTDPTPLVSTPGRLVASRADRVDFTADAPATIVVRVRWSRWLTVKGGCVGEGPDGWTAVRVPRAGRYTLTSQLGGSRCAGP